MYRSHIIQKLNNGRATTFCGRTGEKREADICRNSFLSYSGKTFFEAYDPIDRQNLDVRTNCVACKRAYDKAQATA